MKKIFMLLVCLCIVLVGCTKPNPMDTANNYLKFWSDEKYQDMYNLLSSSSQAEIDKDTFEDRYKTIFSAIKLNKLEIAPEEILIEKDNAYLPFKAVFHTQTVGRLEQYYSLPLTLESKEWRVVWSPSLIFPMLEEGDKVRITEKSAHRGAITDPYGSQLAVDGPAYTIGAKPDAIPDTDEFIKALAPLLEMDEKTIQKILSQKWVQENPDHFVPIKNLPFNITEEYKEDLLSIKGTMLSSKSHTTRQYPQEEIYAHITGYVQEISQEELAEKSDKGYIVGDFIGRNGLEAALEENLRSKRGYTLYVEDNDKQQKGIIAKTEAQNGDNVLLTIQPELQALVHTLLEGYKGSIIALNPGTGEILAMASQPAYEPNVFPLGVSSSLWKKISEDPDHPLINRNIKSLYPPGSVFKPFTAAMALQEGVINTQTIVKEAQNEEWFPSQNWDAPPIKRVPHPSGDVNLRNAMVWSDNIFFAWTTLKLGSQAFESLAGSYGLGTQLPFSLSVKTSQIKNDSTQWTESLLANTGYGQGEMLVTPLQMAAMFTAFCNQGNMMLPQLVKEIRTSSGEVLESLEPTVWIDKAIPEPQVETILPMLVDTVEDSTGTAYKVKIPGLNIAGKTGTAQMGSKKEQEIAWFIGFTINTEKPLLVCIALEVPAGQGEAKLEMARKIFLQYCK